MHSGFLRIGSFSIRSANVSRRPLPVCSINNLWYKLLSDNLLTEMKVVAENECIQQQSSDQQEVPIRVVLPFKDQKSANSVRRQLSDLSRKINAEIRPVYTSRKIKDEIKVKEQKPPVVNQQCAVFQFKCDLCDTDYVGYSCRHLHQRIEEHKG